MHFAPVTKAAGTAGNAEGSTPLNAFDNALLAAGIGNINLIKVSSILPPGVELVALPRIKPGALVPTAYAAMTSEVPGEVVAAAAIGNPERFFEMLRAHGLDVEVLDGHARTLLSVARSAACVSLTMTSSAARAGFPPSTTSCRSHSTIIGMTSLAYCLYAA